MFMCPSCGSYNIHSNTTGCWCMNCNWYEKRETVAIKDWRRLWE